MTNSKTILFLIDCLGSGGAQRQIVTLALLLKSINHNVSLLVYHEDNFFKEKLDEEGVPVFLVQAGNPLIRIMKIRKFIRSGNFDVVISFLVVPNFLNCIAAIGKRSWKVIVSERSAKLQSFTSLRGKIFSWFYRFSDSIVCNSNNSKQLLQTYYPEYTDKLTVIYNPVILPSNNKTYLPKNLGKLHLVIAASYQYLKNPMGLAKAVSLMTTHERSKFSINWYGSKKVTVGGERAYLETLNIIESHNLNDIIHLDDPIQNIDEKMMEADMVGLFSDVEGLPNSICEAMMLGKPVIMTKVSDYDELVTPENGFLCELNDVESFKSKLIEASLLSENDLLRMGNYSRDRAEKLFDPTKILIQWTKIIN